MPRPHLNSEIPVPNPANFTYPRPRVTSRSKKLKIEDASFILLEKGKMNRSFRMVARIVPAYDPT